MQTIHNVNTLESIWKNNILIYYSELPAELQTAFNQAVAGLNAITE